MVFVITKFPSTQLLSVYFKFKFPPLPTNLVTFMKSEFSFENLQKIRSAELKSFFQRI